MAVRGENIGTAYIRILADGSGIDRSIRDEFDDVDFEALGRKGSKEWQEGFIKEQERGPTATRMKDAVVGPLIRGKWLSEKFFGGKAWATFENDMNKHFRSAGRLAVEGLEKELLEGLDLGELDKRMGNMQRDVLRAQRAINKAHLEAINEDEQRALAVRLARDREFEQNTLQLHEDFLQETLDRDREFEQRAAALHEQMMQERMNRDREFEMNHARLAAEALKAEEAVMKQRLDLDRQFEIRHAQAAESERKRAEAQRIMLAKLRDDFLTIGYDASRLLSGKTSKGLSDVRERVGLLQEAIRSNNIDNQVWVHTLEDTDKALRNLNPRFRVVNRGIDRFADGMGSAFGRGARNDVVNFVGSMVRGLFRIPRLLTGVAEMMSTTTGRMKLLTGSVAGIGGAFAFVGPVISLISLAGAAVTALASTAAMAAVGGIGALGGAAIATAGMIATLSLALTHATPEAKKAGKEIKGVVNDLGDVAAQHVFADVSSQARGFAGVLRGLRPVVAGIGDSISEVAGYWVGLMQDDSFDKFVNSMENRLPQMTEDLGKTIANIVTSIGGLFRGIAPVAQEFTTWLRQGSREFMNWSNSKQGIADIRAFMDDAADSARDLGGFLAAVGDLFGTIITQGNDAGDSLFRSMTKTLEGWDKALEADPSIIRKWTESGADLARGLGRVVVNAGRLADVLDNTFSRNIAVGAINAIAGALELITAPLRLVANLFGKGENQALAFAGQMAGMAIVFRTFGGRFSGVTTALSGFVGDMRNGERRMSRFKSAASGLAGVGGLAALTMAAGETDQKMRALEGAIGGALLGFQVGGPWGAAIGGVAGGLLGMSDAFGSASDSARQLKTSQQLVKESAEGLRQTLNQVTGAATQETRALTASRLQKDGAIEAANRLGISSRDLVSASLGNERAQDRVNAAYAQGKKRMNELIESGHPMSRGFGRLTKDMDLVRGSVGFLNNEYDKQRRKQEAMADAAMTWAQALRGVPKKVHSDVRALGADASISDVAQLVAQYDLTPKQVRTVVDAIGANFSARQVQNLNRDFKNLPKKVETRLDTLNWDTTAGQIAGLRREYDLTPKQISTVVRATGLAKTDADVKRLVDKIIALDKKKAIPGVDVDSKKFDADIARLFRDVLELDGKKPTPKADLDTDQLKSGKTAADALLRALAGERPTPKADLDPGAFHSAYSGIMSDLNIFDGKTVNANAGVNVNRGGLDSLMTDLNGLMDKTVTVTTEYVATGSGRVPARSAAGRITSGPMYSLIGEAGPEAVVPLNRPLGQVDPAVRALSAFAQGKIEELKGMASGGVAGGGKTYNVNQYITTPNSDARAVAAETVNKLVAVGY